MFLCYIDESGTAELPGNTSHYVLAGLSIPIVYWKSCESDIIAIKRRYELESAEIHTAWLLRSYPEQSKIKNFDALDTRQRRSEVEKARKQELLDLQRARKPKAYQQSKKNFRKTEAYIHLTRPQRFAFIEEIARAIGNWGFARLFAECIDKIHFDPNRTQHSADEQAFEQIVSRFEQFLKATAQNSPNFSLLIHDNNPTVAKKHTDLMKTFHQRGTLWTTVQHIIETPLFVNSELTSMVQLADVCSYSLRRYLENNEDNFFDHVFKRADRRNNLVVGVRHFTVASCTCKICVAHRPPSAMNPRPISSPPA